MQNVMINTNVDEPLFVAAMLHVHVTCSENWTPSNHIYKRG